MFLLGLKDPFSSNHTLGHSSGLAQSGASATPRTRGVCLWNGVVDLQQRRLAGATGEGWNGVKMYQNLVVS